MSPIDIRRCPTAGATSAGSPPAPPARFSLGLPGGLDRHGCSWEEVLGRRTGTSWEEVSGPWRALIFLGGSLGSLEGTDVPVRKPRCRRQPRTDPLWKLRVGKGVRVSGVLDSLGSLEGTDVPGRKPQPPGPARMLLGGNLGPLDRHGSSSEETSSPRTGTDPPRRSLGSLDSHRCSSRRIGSPHEDRVIHENRGVHEDRVGHEDQAPNEDRVNHEDRVFTMIGAVTKTRGGHEDRGRSRRPERPANGLNSRRSGGSRTLSGRRTPLSGRGLR